MSQHLHNSNKPFFNVRRLAARRAIFYPSVSGGVPPRLLPPSGGFGLSPGAWGAQKRRMPTGPRAFREIAGCVWATALQPDPPLKGLVPYLPVCWGRQQIPLAPGKAHLRRNPAFCAVAFTLSSGVGPTSCGRSAFFHLHRYAQRSFLGP